jgi:photosystem II stability/assembly factor-like uncharacterized protein
MDHESEVENRLRRYARAFRREANPRAGLSQSLINGLDRPARRESTLGMVPAVAMASLVLVGGLVLAFGAWQLRNLGRPTASPPVAITTPTASSSPQPTPSPSVTPTATATPTSSTTPSGAVPGNVPGLASIQMVGPHLGWAVGSQGIYATSDGQHWSRQYASSEQFVGLDFISATTGWVVGTQSLLGTTDGGRTWHQLGEAQQWIRSVHFINATNGWGIAGGADPLTIRGIVIPSMGATLVETSNGGRSWTDLAAPSDPQSVCFSDASHGWLSTEPGGVYRSTDGGRSWSKVLQMAGGQPQLPAESRIECASPSAAWVQFSPGGAAAGHIPYIVYATVNGQSWRAVMEESMTMQQDAPGVPAGPGSYPGAFSVVDPNDAVFVGDTPPANAASVMIATNGGATLKTTGSIPGPSETYDAAFVSTSAGWVLEVDTNNQVVIDATTDGGYHWTQQLAVSR